MATTPAEAGQEVNTPATLLAVDVGVAQGKKSDIDYVEPVPLGGYKKKIVDLLNPRLHNYSHPWKLAVAIGFSSFILFLVSFILIITVCPTDRRGLTIGSSEEHKETILNGDVACVETVVYLTKVDHHDERGHREMIGQHGCEIDGNWMAEQNLAWCEGHTPQENLEIYGHDSGMTTPCPGSENPHHYLYGMYYQERNCPSGGVAFGSALAYTAYIEMFFTFLFVGLFVKNGSIKPLNRDTTLFSTAAAANNSNREMDKVKDELVLIKKQLNMS